MKIAHTATTQVEAMMLKGLLEEAGIPVFIRPNQVPGYELTVGGMGGSWGDLMVPEDRQAEAKRIIQEYLETLRGTQ